TVRRADQVKERYDRDRHEDVSERPPPARPLVLGEQRLASQANKCEGNERASLSKKGAQPCSNEPQQRALTWLDDRNEQKRRHRKREDRQNLTANARRRLNASKPAKQTPPGTHRRELLRVRLRLLVLARTLRRSLGA